MICRETQYGLGFVLAVALLGSSASSAALILKFDGTSVSSNTPATGAAAEIAFAFETATAPPDPDGDITVTLTVNNTTGQSPNPTSGSAGATAATLLGFGFDLPTGVSVLPGWYVVNPADSFPNLLANVEVNPFGGVDVYFANNSNPQGGNPDGGLTAGMTATIEFDIVTSIALDAIEQSFFDVLSTNCDSAGNSCTDELATSVARFQQVNAGSGSDILLGYVVRDSNPDDPQQGDDLPIPAPLALLGLGGLMLGWITRKSRA